MTEKKKQLAHLFDATQCINCGACSVACAQTNYPELINEFNPGWNTIYCNIRQVKVEKKRPLQILVQCQQCSDAPCVDTCPFGANYYDENGMVRNDPNKCIGCNYCIASCPYNCRWTHPITGLPSKCMGKGCLDLIAQGQQPACVTACPAEARLFGDTNDPESAISRRLAKNKTAQLLEQRGTKPNFYVVVSK
ncbi:MAG: 4Fe-4S dicluster domain-containing protein [Duodenibacillus sp.]